MRQLRAWLLRFGALFYKSRAEKELNEEIEGHLQLHIDDGIRAGLSPEEAPRVALLKFGGVEAAKEAWRDRRGIPFLETIVQDLFYAVRMLKSNKGWTAVGVLSLALGIGANTALFNLVNSILLEKLPVRNPDELVTSPISCCPVLSDGKESWRFGWPSARAAPVWSASC